MSEKPVVELNEREQNDVEEHLPQRSPVIFETIRRAGQDELERPWVSLWWSGLAAGISMGFSLLTQAFLRDILKGFPASEFLEKFGYCVGFLIVILARQQLFTENTLMSVLPVMAHFHRDNLRNFARLWGTVLAANVVGTILFALFLAHGHVLSPEVTHHVHDISLQPFSHPFAEVLTRGIAAGFIIASLVWILANVESKIGIIVILTYLVALGNFAHIIAGSAEAAYVVIDGSISFTQAVTGFFIPALIGNVTGGTLLFAVLCYGQTHQELVTDERADRA